MIRIETGYLLIILTAWLMGIALAKGTWSTILAIFFPFWAWYLLTEQILKSVGWL
jgi:hypothetical protein